MGFWSMEKRTDEELILITNSKDSEFGKILDVRVPDEPGFEDGYVKMIFSTHEDALLSLAKFEPKWSSFSRMFANCESCSSDFVSRWNERWKNKPSWKKDQDKSHEHEEKAQIGKGNKRESSFTDYKKDEFSGSNQTTPATLNKAFEESRSDNSIEELECAENTTQEQESNSEELNLSKTKQQQSIRKKVKISGRKRAIWAWERNLKGGFDKQIVVYGGEGWPPPFRSLVQEMRDFMFKETGLKHGWDEDDASMMRKYFYLKYRIPHVNTSALTLHVKLASMSPRCYDMALKIMDLYQTGQLERKRPHKNISLAVHASYFNFLYNYNVREQEDKVYSLLSNVCDKKKRPESKRHRQPVKQKEEREYEEEMAKANNSLEATKKDLKTAQEEMEVLKRKVTELVKIMEKELDRQLEAILPKPETMFAQYSMDLDKAKKDNEYMASSLTRISKENKSLKEELNKSKARTTVEPQSSTYLNPVRDTRTAHKRKSPECNNEEAKRRQRQPLQAYETKSVNENNTTCEANEIVRSESIDENSHTKTADQNKERQSDFDEDNIKKDSSQEQVNETVLSTESNDWRSSKPGQESFYDGRI